MTFSPANLRRIWEFRTRKGEHLSHRVPSVEKAEAAIKQAKSHRNGADDAELTNLRKKREHAIEHALKKISSDIHDKLNTGTFSWGLTKQGTIATKDLYEISKSDPVVYFVQRAIEHELRGLFNISPTNRTIQCEQLYLSLNNKVESLIVRSDIKDFYESIDHRILLSKIGQNEKVPRSTLSLVEQLLSEYSALSGAPTGIPRGTGLSATLAEVYLQDFDRQFRSLESNAIYLRYVDDFILLIPTGQDSAHTKAVIKQHLRRISRQFKLSLNSSKTRYFYSNDARFSFLGYSFKCNNASVLVDLSPTRLKRIQDKITLSFDACANNFYRNRAQVALVDRIEFLSSNTRLSNNKRHALVGITFSNSNLTPPSPGLEKLNKHLKRLVKQNQALLSQQSVDKLINIDFQDAWKRHKFKKHSPKKLRNITRIWKH